MVSGSKYANHVSPINNTISEVNDRPYVSAIHHLKIDCPGRHPRVCDMDDNIYMEENALESFDSS